MGEELYELPKGWVWVELGDILEKIETINPSIKPEQEFIYLDITSIDNSIQRITEPKKYFGKNAPSRARQLVKAGDILFSTVRTYLKNIAVVPDIYHNQIASTGFCVIRPHEQISQKFIFLITQNDNFLEPLNQLQRGSSYPAVRDSDVFAQKIPLPPLPEQYRIVAKIEEIFTELDAGVELLKKLKAKLKRYRQAVLKAAVEGNLTKEWREANQGELESASMLRDRILKQRREKWEAEQLAKMKAQGKTPKDDSWKLKYKEPVAPDISDLPDLPDGWCWVNLEQLSEVVRGASPRPAGDPKFFGGNIPWITVGCLTADTQPYLMSVSEFVTEAGKAASRYIEPETLLLTNSGATLGVPKITKIGGCINDGSVALLHVDYPIKLYLYYLLSSITKQLRAINQGAAQPNLNTGIVKAILVPLPPLMEQKEIIKELEHLFSVTNQLERTIDANLKRAEKLRQSILKQTFEGKLVPQDPNDEPAEKLLERIKAEKAKIEAEKKPKRQPKIRSSQPRKSQTTTLQLEFNFNE
jgi:type I restriction enzyme S subunit